MSVVPPSLLAALEADASLWPGLGGEGETRAALERMLAPLPAEVTAALLSGMIDPDRADWSRAGLLGLDLATEVGATVLGLANDELVELVDARGERFGLLPIGFRVPVSAYGAPADTERLLAGLDRTFGHRRYVLYVRRPVPDGLDVQPIVNAVQLWLAQLDGNDTLERHAVYEDEDVALDLTVIDADLRVERGGRILSVPPIRAPDDVKQVEAVVLDAAARSEEALGSLPLVVVVAADRPWRVPRGVLQRSLYGPAHRVLVDGPYEAEFTPDGPAFYGLTALRSVVSSWWIGSSAAPFGYRAERWDNPWAATPLELRPVGRRFAVVGDPDRSGRAVLRWAQ